MQPKRQYNTPGQLIQDLLDKRGWTQRVLAVILQADETGINKIIAGKRPVDAELALALSEVLHEPAESFLELQKHYDLVQARILSRGDPERSTRAHLFGNLPVAEMIKRGWLDADDVRNYERVEAALIKFFDVPSVDKIEIFPHVSKKT